MKPTLPRIRTVLFVSGLCSLVYQVVWLRSLRMVFGSSTPATAVVLAIFMGGLGLGGYYFGRRVERSANALALYARLELGIAAAAAASPLLIDLVRELYLGLGGVSTLGMAGATALRLALATAVLALPTTLMGGTLPAVAQAMERRGDHGRRIVAGFYGVNTLGAVSGALLTTFVLIELVGVRRSLWLACLLNLLLALVARAWARALDEAGAPAADNGDASPAGETTAPEETSRPRVAPLFLLSAAAVVGFVFFLMELVWYRMLAPLLGGSSYTFGLILALALCGIGGGGWLYSLGSERRRPVLGGLALSLTLEALLLALPFALGDRLTFFAGVLRGLDGGGFAALVFGWTLVAGLVVFPVAVVSGYQFPLLVALLGRGRHHVGSEVGRAYAWNTWGAVAGSLAGGFLLLPLLGAPRLWRASIVFLAGCGAALAIAAARHERRRPERRRHSLAAIAACGALSLALALAPGPSAFWRHTPVGAGRAELEPADRNELRREVYQTRRTTLREAEGVESSVALLIHGELALFVNGKSDGSARSDAPMQVMGGLVGGLLHPAPRQVLVIGLGTGMTAGWLAQIETVETVDAVELEPAVAEFSREFGAAAFDVLELPNVVLHYGDGREYVRTTPRRYDVIFSEPSNPYRAGVADLFSQEFYRAVAERLEPGGVFLHWLQGYEVDADLVRTVYSTLASVFGHVESWQVHSTDLLLVASRERLVHDLDAIRRRARLEPFRSGLEKTWLVDGAEGFYTAFIGGHELTAGIATDDAWTISRDDRPIIEFSFARSMGRQGLFHLAELHALARHYGAQRPPARGEPIDWDQVAELRRVRAAAGTFSEIPEPQPDDGVRKRHEARLAYRDADLATAARLWFSQSEPARAIFDRFLVAEALADAADPRAGAALADLAETAPTEALLVAARLAWRQGDRAAAVERLIEGFEALRDDHWAFRPIVDRGLGLVSDIAKADASTAGRFFEALDAPFPGYVLEELRWLRRLEMAMLEDFDRRCVEALAPFEPHPIWEENFLATRLRCYEAAGHRRAATARRHLAQFQAEAPPRLFTLRAPDPPDHRAEAR